MRSRPQSTDPSPSIPAPQPPPGQKSRLLSMRLLLWLGIVFIVLFSLGPLLWGLLTSLKTNSAITADRVIYWPRWHQLTLLHYYQLLVKNQFYLYIFNSGWVAVISTGLCLGIGAPAAYALARLKLPGERIILLLILLVTLFPYILLFLGVLELVQITGLANHYLALIIPYTAINLPLTILVMRSFFQQLPKELEDSAQIDGYNTVQMLWQIVLPLTVPALVTTGILTFIFAWNEYLFALTFITRESMKTIPVAAAQLGSTSTFEVPHGPLAAATVLGTLPLVLLVLFFQRKIVQGLTAGAVKG